MFFTSSQSFSDLMEDEFQDPSNENNNLLRTLIPDEVTIKHYLSDSDEPSPAHSCQRFSSLLTSSMRAVQNNWPDTELDWATHDQSPSDSLPDSTPDSHGNNSPDILSDCQLPINTRRDNLKLNFILLVEHGYKLTLTLNTDNSQVNEVWHPNVIRQILTTQYSSISLKSEYMATKSTLDSFESLYIEEAIAAFQGQIYFPLTNNLFNRSNAKAHPNEFVSTCNRIRGFRKLERCDKITLLSNIFYDLFIMKGVIKYDPTIDGWQFSESGHKTDRRDLFLFDRFLHDGIVYIIETYPDRYRNDLKAVILIYLLIIFNPDLSDLKHPETVKCEQLTYIYLLQRYLRTTCDSECEASENHYRLMAKVDQVRLLGKKVHERLTQVMNGTLEKCIAEVIQP